MKAWMIQTKNNKFHYILKTFKEYYSEMYIACKYGQILERKKGG